MYSTVPILTILELPQILQAVIRGLGIASLRRFFSAEEEMICSALRFPSLEFSVRDIT